MQAEEARVAVRAAEIATQVAMEAQAAAHSALSELHAASAEQPARGPAVVESISRQPRVEVKPQEPEPMLQWIEDAPAIASNPHGEQDEPKTASAAATPQQDSIVTQEVVDGRSLKLRWEPDLPARAVQMPAPVRAQEQFELSPEDWWTPARVSATLHSEPLEVDPRASHANLIEFPRELVAARKMRPRLAETVAGIPLETEAQLSIFEVDPGAVSTEPMTETLAPKPAIAEWNGPGWSGMELDAHPASQEAPRSEAAAKRSPQLAPLGLRLLSMVVDGSLILAAFFAVAVWMASKMGRVPAQNPAEVMAVLALLVTGFAYHAVFFTLGGSTPGMRYSGIALCTFNNEVPTRRQLRRRLGAMALSLLPVGLGLVWGVFDEDHLSWHDRISGTYLRKR